MHEFIKIQGSLLELRRLSMESLHGKSWDAMTYEEKQLFNYLKIDDEQNVLSVDKRFHVIKYAHHIV